MAISNLLTGSSVTVPEAGLGGSLSSLQPLQDLAVSALGDGLLGELASGALAAGLDSLDTLLTTESETLSYTIQEIASASEPQRSWKWMVQFPDIVYLTGMYSIPTWMVLSITPTFVNTDVNNYWIGGQPSNYPSDQSVGQVHISVYLDETLIALNYLQIWRSLVRNADRTFNYPSVYKKPIYLTLLTKTSKATKQLVLRNCFPVSASIGTLTYKGSEHMTLDLTVSVDDFTITPSPVNQVANIASSAFGASFNQLLINPVGTIASSLLSL